MNANLTDLKQREKNYLSQLKSIIKPESFLDKADLMPYCENLVDSIVRKEDFLYYNDNNPQYNLATTKTSLIYKMMFDFSEKSAYIFSHGFDSDAFDKFYVIEAFRRFVFRVMDNLKDDSKDIYPPLILISKARIEDLDRNIRSSNFFKEVMMLSNTASTSNKVFSCFYFDYKSRLDDIIKIDSVHEDEQEIGVKIALIPNREEIEVLKINSFSIFDGCFYRIEKNEDNGEAYVNFGDKKNAAVISDYFKHLKTMGTEFDVSNIK